MFVRYCHAFLFVVGSRHVFCLCHGFFVWQTTRTQSNKVLFCFLTFSLELMMMTLSADANEHWSWWNGTWIYGFYQWLQNAAPQSLHQSDSKRPWRTQRSDGGPSRRHHHYHINRQLRYGSSVLRVILQHWGNHKCVPKHIAHFLLSCPLCSKSDMPEPTAKQKSSWLPLTQYENTGLICSSNNFYSL